MWRCVMWKDVECEKFVLLGVRNVLWGGVMVC